MQALFKNRLADVRKQKFLCRIVRKTDKKPVNICRVDIVSDKEKIHLQYMVQKEYDSKLNFDFLKDKEFKLVVDRGVKTIEFVFDGKKNDLGDIEI